MSNEMFTQLPSTPAAQLSDIICAVQGYSSPSALGTSVQETLQQVLSLITAGTNISVAFSGGNLVISGTGAASIGWNSVTSTSQLMVADAGYVTNNASLVTLTLPATASFGTFIYIQGLGGGGWEVAQQAGQQIVIGSSASTVGVTGFIASTNQHDSILLMCGVANTTFLSLGGPQGNITVN